MSILTGRDLEFLDSLRTSWPRLYWNELARLRKEEDSPRSAQPEVHAKARQSGPGGKILAFAPMRAHNMIAE
jgi:hypothetical protein